MSVKVLRVQVWIFACFIDIYEKQVGFDHIACYPFPESCFCAAKCKPDSLNEHRVRKRRATMASPKASKVSPLSASWMFVVAFSAASLIARTSPVNNDDPCATFRSSNGGGTDGTSAFALICTCNTTIADGRSFHQVNCIDTDLTSVPVGLPSNIDNFRLEGNHFHILEHISYTALHNLFLDNNDIRFIKDLAFSNLSHLIQLHLGSNKISGLSAKTFVGLRGLKTLFMRNNRLYELESETFSGGALPKLELLILASCRIVRIAPDAFQGATSLTMLDLSDNMLTSPVQFLGHLKIDTLNLSANHVENLSNSPFQYLTRLETLSLSHNQIFNLSVTAFRGLAQLTLLDLNNNSISSIDSGTLEVSDRLIELDLSSNSLRSAPEGAFPWGSLSKLRVHGNPWTCDCRTKWLHNQPVVIEWNLNSNLRYTNHTFIQNFRCKHSQL